MTVHYDLHGEVALIRLDNPPMNGLSLAIRQAAVKALEQARQDPESIPWRRPATSTRFRW